MGWRQRGDGEAVWERAHFVPVLDGVSVSVVAHHQHTVVELCTARCVENATLVVLKGGLISLDRYRDRAEGRRGNKCLL